MNTMATRNTSKLGLLSLGVALFAAAVPGLASAQDKPSYASADEDTVHGRIVNIAGPYDISVRDDKGYVDHVQLHQGTIINPTGLSLHTGMTVTVLGINSGSTLAANEVDTPYTYAPNVAYGYPGYGGYPYGYDYPSVAIGFGFGGGYGRFGGRFR